MLLCRKAKSLLPDYLDGKVPFRVLHDLESHLAKCQDCQTLFESALKTLRLMNENRPFEVPKSVAERIKKNVMGGVQAKKKVPRKP